jgi:hypothetical protein
MRELSRAAERGLELTKQCGIVYRVENLPKFSGGLSATSVLIEPSSPAGAGIPRKRSE